MDKQLVIDFSEAANTNLLTATEVKQADAKSYEIKSICATNCAFHLPWKRPHCVFGDETNTGQ